jgi:hypothetical protein
MPRGRTVDDVLQVFGAAAFGAILGASLAWIVDRRKAQVETAFAMHREYFDSLVEARELSARFVLRHRRDGDLASLWKTLSAADMECIWKIVYFYERLWVAMKHRYVSRSLVPDLFGDAFNYWYKECFEEQLVPIDDPTSRHIADLRTRVLATATKDQIAGWERYRQVWQLESRGNPPGER